MQQHAAPLSGLGAINSHPTQSFQDPRRLLQMELFLRYVFALHHQKVPLVCINDCTRTHIHIHARGFNMHRLDQYGTIIYPALTSRNRDGARNSFSSFNNTFFHNNLTRDMKVSDVASPMRCINCFCGACARCVPFAFGSSLCHGLPSQSAPDSLCEQLIFFCARMC